MIRDRKHAGVKLSNEKKKDKRKKLKEAMNANEMHIILYANCANSL